jgi:hypothetical protein
MKYKNPYLIYAIGRALGTKQVASAEFDGRIEVTKYDDNGNIEHVYNYLEDIPLQMYSFILKQEKRQKIYFCTVIRQYPTFYVW